MFAKFTEKFTSIRIPAFLLLLSIGSHEVVAGDKVNWEEAPIRYSESEPKRNAISHLQMQLDNSSILLEHSGEQGYLQSVLKHLQISTSSQVLVFSKTSLQDNKISPSNPRAIYFNDETHVGYVRDGLIEIAAADADLGMVFYTLDPEKVERPKFVRQANRCLSCHGAARTKGVPGLLVRSVYPNLKGEPVVKAGGFLSNHRSPLSQRWGGWYVTGTHGDQQHMGNYRLEHESKPKKFDNEGGMNLRSLESCCDTKHYLSRDSDIVALMVLEHQIEAYNLLTHANFVAQRALMERESSLSNGNDLTVANRMVDDAIRNAVRPLVHYLFFAQEASLTGPVVGTSDYQQDFEAMGFDVKNKTFRKFDLKSRLFQIPFSYLFYTKCFAEQPPELLKVVVEEIDAILVDPNPSANTFTMSLEDRNALKDLLKEYPPSWYSAFAKKE